MQFTPKYRRDVFESAVVLDSYKRVFYDFENAEVFKNFERKRNDIANCLGVDLEAVEFGPEHVHFEILFKFQKL